METSIDQITDLIIKIFLIFCIINIIWHYKDIITSFETFYNMIINYWNIIFNYITGLI